MRDAWRLALGTLTALPVQAPSHVDQAVAARAALLAPVAAVPLGTAVAVVLACGQVLDLAPLASGLLSGRYDESTTFAANDHRNYNRHGEAFDQGETFSGVDYDTGLEAAQRFVDVVPAGTTPAQFALRWVIAQPGVTTVIPGASSVQQAEANAAAADLSAPTAEESSAIERIYEDLLATEIDPRW